MKVTTYHMNSADIFHIQIDETCRQNCLYANGIGCLAPAARGLVDFRRSLQKAKAGNFSTVQFPCNFEDSKAPEVWIQTAIEHGFKVLLQINLTRVLAQLTIGSPPASIFLQAGVQLNLLIAEFDLRLVPHILQIEEKYQIRKVSILVTKDEIPSVDFLRKLHSVFSDRIEFHFPLPVRLDSPFLKTKKVYKLVKQWRNEVPELKVQGPQGHDLHEPRAHPLAEFVPLLEPLLQTESTVKAPIKLSFVIPTYNQSGPVTRTLQHIAMQNLPPEFYEVVLVDDGGSDDLWSTLEVELQAWRGRRNFRGFRFPRLKDRQMGDSGFRAGVARNVGAQHSRGEALAFLDADILVPKNYATQILLELENADLVQCRRLELSEKFTQSGSSMDRVDPRRDLVNFENRYWGRFYASAHEWNRLPAAWKYVCTHSLSVHRQTFLRLGGFRRNYVFYGFEDTDFGYRLQKAGGKFHLSQLQVHHQFHPVSRSEFSANAIRREEVLSKTAKTFFLNNLDPEIFESLYSLVGKGFNLFEYWMYFRSQWPRSKRKSHQNSGLN